MTTALLEQPIAASIAQHLLRFRSAESAKALEESLASAVLRLKETGKLPCNSQSATLLLAGEIAARRPFELLAADFQNDICLQARFAAALSGALRNAYRQAGLPCREPCVAEHARRPMLPLSIFEDNPGLARHLAHAKEPGSDPLPLQESMGKSILARQSLAELFLAQPGETEQFAIQTFLNQGGPGTIKNESFGPACETLAALADEQTAQGAHARNWLRMLELMPWGGGSAAVDLLARAGCLYEKHELARQAGARATPQAAKSPGL